MMAPLGPIVAMPVPTRNYSINVFGAMQLVKLI